MLIRHAEKPSANFGGVDEAGMHDSRSLSVPGWRRAGALVRYFGTAVDGGDGPVHCPRHIVAARPTNRHPSTRPRDTVKSLAGFLGLTIDDSWSDGDDLQALAHALRSLDGTVLVCWRHDQLPRLASELLPDDRIPAQWPAHRFDVTWSISFARGSGRFSQIPQSLLPGDSEEAIGGG